MCKVFAITNMANVKVNKRFVSVVRNEVCKSGDKDGFGYAVLNEDGSIGGERTMRPLKFSPLAGDPMKTVTGSLPIINKTRNVFGKSDFSQAKSFIGHGRYSTNEVTMSNTHPFYDGNIALIHNGVVTDPDSVITGLTTTCDTEIILKAWALGGMDKVAKTVTGYYALAVLDSRTSMLHVVRDDRAMLHIAYSRTIDSFIIATTTDIIKGVAKKMKWQIETPEELLENMHVIFDRNDIVDQSDFSPRISTTRTYMTETERKALGYSEIDMPFSHKTRSHSGSNYGWPASETGIYDATMAPIAPEDEEEPAYREKSQNKLQAEIVLGEQERSMIDDGCPSAEVESYDDDKQYSMSGIDGYDDAYNLNKKMIS